MSRKGTSTPKDGENPLKHEDKPNPLLAIRAGSIYKILKQTTLTYVTQLTKIYFDTTIDNDAQLTSNINNQLINTLLTQAEASVITLPNQTSLTLLTQKFNYVIKLQENTPEGLISCAGSSV